MYGKGENISDPNINEKKIKNLLSGKTYADENFPVASFIVKKDIQKYIRTFYFFARMADDIADHHKLSSSEKVKILLYFDNALKLKIKTDIKVLNNMVDLFPELPFGKKYSRNLLKAFLMDAKGKIYNNWNDLLFYCRYSANPVGRFVIDLVHYKEQVNENQLNRIYNASDFLCTSLQIINHIQDCKKDFNNLNRVYIPKSLFKKHNISKKFLNNKNSSKNFKILIIEIIDKIEAILQNCHIGLNLIKPWRLRKETLIILNIAKRLCNLLKKEDPLKKNVKLSRIDLIFCFIKGII